MTVQDYYETRARTTVNITIANRGTVKCRPNIVFDEKTGKTIGIIINNQMISEEQVDIQDIK